jgi:predicted RNA methylase
LKSRNLYARGINPMTTSSANVVVPIVVKLVNPHSVVDVGCGPGVWTLAFMQNGVKEVLAIDGKWQIQQLIIPKENFLAHDLNFDLKLDRRFD